ncbi:MAG TPA: DUF2634 domain-containing protein [Symbiobacteriaceae bacterium]|jgi:hypothetical protein|nr:DUF2634 domain-containing protein [Symbiobacteriaceae bacterium]
MSILPAATVPAGLMAEVVTRQVERVGRNPVFDFTAGEFVRTATGRVSTVEGEPSLVLWITKALITPRGVLGCYTESFGNETHSLIGTPLPDSILFMEVERLCREALVYDPRIKDASQFEFERKGDQLYVSFTVEHVEGLSDVTVGLEVK